MCAVGVVVLHIGGCTLPSGVESGVRGVNGCNGSEMLSFPIHMEEGGAAEILMSRTEVTNEQFLRFLEDSGRPRPEAIRMSNPKAPVVGISYEYAIEYCRWAGGRLPTKGEVLSLLIDNWPAMEVNHPGERGELRACGSRGWDCVGPGIMDLVGNADEYLDEGKTPGASRNVEILRTHWEQGLRDSPVFFDVVNRDSGGALVGFRLCIEPRRTSGDSECLGSKSRR